MTKFTRPAFNSLSDFSVRNNVCTRTFCSILKLIKNIWHIKQKKKTKNKPKDTQYCTLRLAVFCRLGKVESTTEKKIFLVPPNKSSHTFCRPPNNSKTCGRRLLNLIYLGSWSTIGDRGERNGWKNDVQGLFRK